MKTSLLKLLICFLLAMAASRGFAENCFTNTLRATNLDSILIRKQSMSKSHRVSLYPDANQKVLFFFVSGEEGRAYQLYIFDLEGKLVKQTEIRNRQTTAVREMEKGIYLFDVFSDDVKISNGQMTVR